jgi:predicted alpha/beta superfamily hydrolase
MLHTKRIRVIYPAGEGRIVLRTENDWADNIEAIAIGADHQSFEFVVTSPKPFLYLKPCLIRDNQFYWSIGNNYLAIMTDSEIRPAYPHFFSQGHGTISNINVLYSKQLARNVQYRIYLPPGYAENTLKRYPVVYMHDGSNLFFPEESFVGREWQIDETLGLLDYMTLIDKVIVVGVYSGDRMTEYTAPGYERYGHFLVEELKPKIDSELRTLPSPLHTAVMGSSLGGVVSFYLAWQWPEVFGKAACLSSTFTYRDDLMRRVEQEPKRPITLYLDSGWPGDNYEVTRAMRDLLAERGYKFGQDLLYFAFPNAAHHEADWAVRAHIPFQFFFAKIPVFG